jgi:4-amino-4-deoxy-L-arabinose transferase-like glycosyltransferase
MDIVVAIPFLLIVFGLYLIQRAVRESKSPLHALPGILVCVGITALASHYLAVVRESYQGHAEWFIEKRFFLQIFMDKLETAGDLKTAAQYMQSPEVRELTFACIRRIVDSFRLKTILFLSSGGVILLLSAASLWLNKLREKRYYIRLLLCCIAVGTGLFDVGIWYRRYAATTDTRLRYRLFQQTLMMKELAELEVDRSIPEIIHITREEADDQGFYHSYGRHLPERLKTGKTERRRDTEPDRNDE